MLLLACVTLSALAAGCGGSASTDTAGNATVSVSTTGASSTLQQIATQAQAVVATKIQALATSTSSDDVAAQLGDAQTQLEDLATRTESVQTDNENAAAARDQLHDALHDLADQVGQAQTSVENGDAQQALQDLLSSPAVADLRQAVQSAMSQSG
jgi:hypothetical protein